MLFTRLISYVLGLMALPLFALYSPLFVVLPAICFGCFMCDAAVYFGAFLLGPGLSSRLLLVVLLLDFGGFSCLVLLSYYAACCYFTWYSYLYFIVTDRISVAGARASTYAFYYDVPVSFSICYSDVGVGVGFGGDGFVSVFLWLVCDFCVLFSYVVFAAVFGSG